MNYEDVPLVKKNNGCSTEISTSVSLYLYYFNQMHLVRVGRGYEEYVFYHAGSTLQTTDTRTDVNNGLISGCRICCLILGIAPLLISCL